MLGYLGGWVEDPQVWSSSGVDIVHHNIFCLWHLSTANMIFWELGQNMFVENIELYTSSQRSIAGLCETTDESKPKYFGESKTFIAIV